MAQGIKTGGRAKGTPNKKENPIVGYIRDHSERAFRPNDDNPDSASDFEMYLSKLSPSQRVEAEIRLLEYHTAKRKAVEGDVNLNIQQELSLEESLRRLITDDND